MEKTLQHKETTQCIGIPSSGSRYYHSHGAEINDALTLILNQSEEIVQSELPKPKIIYLSGITLSILYPSYRKLPIDKLRLLSETGQSLIAFDANYRLRFWDSPNAA